MKKLLSLLVIFWASLLAQKEEPTQNRPRADDRLEIQVVADSSPTWELYANSLVMGTRGFLQHQDARLNCDCSWKLMLKPEAWGRIEIHLQRAMPVVEGKNVGFVVIYPITHFSPYKISRLIFGFMTSN